MKKNRICASKPIKLLITRALLWPFTRLYEALMNVRNYLYSRELLSSHSSPQFSLVVGNLTVGGTGKTPMVEYLVRELAKKNRVVTLSRGYGRRSKGFVLATPETTAQQIGDEPLQYYEKFPDLVYVAVCENRVQGARALHRLFPEHNVLVLDDAFQHRPLRADRYLLLNDYNRPFYHDSTFPGGRLRESRRGAYRADAVITTKCPPDLHDNQRESIKQEIRRWARPEAPIFFSGVRYGALRSFEDREVEPVSVSLVTGIAQPQAFVDYVRHHYSLEWMHLFSDHHAYTERDVETILKNAKNTDLIITTEKDKVKLRPLARQAGASTRFGFIPIEIDFGRDTRAFHAWLQQQVEKPMLDRMERF